MANTKVQCDGVVVRWEHSGGIIGPSTATAVRASQRNLQKVRTHPRVTSSTLADIHICSTRDGHVSSLKNVHKCDIL